MSRWRRQPNGRHEKAVEADGMRRRVDLSVWQDNDGLQGPNSLRDWIWLACWVDVGGYGYGYGESARPAHHCIDRGSAGTFAAAKRAAEAAGGEFLAKRPERGGSLAIKDNFNGASAD